MKKIANFWLMAALVCGLAVSVTSCKDDDDDNTNGDTPEAEAAETDQAVAALRWLVALTDTRELSDNWASQTYEPTVGQASTQNELNRVKVVNDLEEAKADFASLAGIGIDGLDAPKTVSDQGVGTLTWTPSASGADNLATVDVQSSLLPRLRQIVYCTGEQTGKNGIFGDNVKGTAYYRFGDVIMDQDGYYWVCVRPCFAPDKGDSHWINIFNAGDPAKGTIPDKYLQKKWDNKSKYNNATIVLPTNLPAEAKHTHNLAQLIQALLNPGDYEETCKKNSTAALGGFDYEYNGRLFVEKVAAYWDEQLSTGYTVWQTLFNRTHAEMQALSELDFINQGYTWGMFAGNTASVYCYKSKDYRTIFKPSDKMEFDVTRGFDVRAFASDPQASANIANDMKQFYSNGAQSFGRWVIRYATGKDLAKSFLNPSPYEKLDHTVNVYVYNQKTNKAVRSDLETERDLGATTDTRCYYHPGDVVRYKNRYYVCATNHRLNEEARFVTLNDQQDHTTGTCSWSGHGDDIVYNDDMASSETLAAWIQNVLMDDTRWKGVVDAMQSRGLSNYTMQVAPQNDVLRKDVVDALFYEQNVIPECYEPDPLHNNSIPITAYYFNELPEVDGDDGISCGIAEKLLSDKFRWAYFAIGSNEYWAPYVVCVTDKDYERITNYISSCKSQSDSHFQWKTLARSIPNTSDVTEKTNYNIVLLAMHWDHNTYYEVNNNYYALLDFTKDWLTHPNAGARDRFVKNPDLWGRRCITSREYVATDNGWKDSKLESVSVQKEQ